MNNLIYKQTMSVCRKIVREEILTGLDGTCAQSHLAQAYQRMIIQGWPEKMARDFLTHRLHDAIDYGFQTDPDNITDIKKTIFDLAPSAS